jgi:CO/xanthine dehydrogenase Mo-binding subunit
VKTGIIGQDFVQGVLDSGDYLGNMQMCLDMIEYDKFRKEIQPKARKEGKTLGIGVVAFTEGTAVGPYEGCRITVSTNGKVTLATSYSTQGQGHFTVFAQIVADALNVKLEDVKVITGDTGHFAWGAGTFASRGATLVGTATYQAAQKVRAKIFATASKALGVPEDQVDLCEGSVCVIGKPDTSISLGELASKANPMRGAVEPGVEPGLEATAYYAPPHGATGSGACAVILDIDPETCKPKIERFVLVHDCGTVINPLLLEGQLQGGVSMGIGNAFYEKLVYDENGQLVTASFMDYLMPLASDMPRKMEMGHLHTPSPLNPLGIKGVGEAGALPPGPAFAQAFEDAFSDRKLEILESNLSPSVVYGYLKKAEQA